MPVFAYKGVDARGKSVHGQKDAESPKGLRAVLRREGVIVTDVSEAKGGKRPGKAGGSILARDIDLWALSLLPGMRWLRFLIPPPVPRAELGAFTGQLATLMKAGIPLADALAAMFDQIERPRLKMIIGEVRTKVNEGSSFADALGKHPRVFEETYVSMVRAGEAAGNLDVVLRKLATFIEKQVALRSKVQGAMMYPIIMAIIGSLIMGLLMVMVIPQITQVFADANQALPWNTALLKWMSENLKKYWWVIGLSLPVGSWAFLRWKISDSGRPIWDRIKLRTPVLGSLVRNIAIARFAGTLGTMLSSGVALLRALDAAKDVLGNAVLSKVVGAAREQIQQGESIATTLKKSGEFPPMVIHMISVGERAGQLEQMLDNVATTYETEADLKLARLTALLTPLMIVIMGVGVGFVVFAILKPMAQMGSLVE